MSELPAQNSDGERSVGSSGSRIYMVHIVSFSVPTPQRFILKTWRKPKITKPVFR